MSDNIRGQVCGELGYREVNSAVDLAREPLPYPDDSFDVVIASHIIDHLENASGALRDWYRVLRPGGVLILGVPMHLGPVAALATLRYRLRGRRPRAHCHFFSVLTLRRFLGGYPVRAVTGYRVFSARKHLPLEDWRWFYRLSTWMGRVFPGLTAEVNAFIEKPAPASSSEFVLATD